MTKRKRLPASDAGEPARRLCDLGGVGKATLRDLSSLGVSSVEQLAKQCHLDLYARLNERYKAARRAERGEQLDACVLDTLQCAIEQARNPDLPAEQCKWWWWSQQRKQCS
jgi:nucleotidyltransferase/DNA polymerase involved in DNA repair